MSTISSSIDSLGKKAQHKKLVAAIQSKKGAVALFNKHKGKAPFGETYTDSRDESMNIVEQVKVLAQTFAEDKQSAIEEENRLQKVFNNLMAEKTSALRTLVTQR